MANGFICCRCDKSMPWGARAGVDVLESKPAMVTHYDDGTSMAEDFTYTTAYYCTQCRWKRPVDKESDRDGE